MIDNTNTTNATAPSNTLFIQYFVSITYAMVKPQDATFKRDNTRIIIISNLELCVAATAAAGNTTATKVNKAKYSV